VCYRSTFWPCYRLSQKKCSVIISVSAHKFQDGVSEQGSTEFSSNQLSHLCSNVCHALEEPDSNLRHLPSDVNEDFPSFLQSPASNTGITTLNTIRLPALPSTSHPITIHWSPSYDVLEGSEFESRYLPETCNVQAGCGTH